MGWSDLPWPRNKCNGNAACSSRRAAGSGRQRRRVSAPCVVADAGARSRPCSRPPTRCCNWTAIATRAGTCCRHAAHRVGAIRRSWSGCPPAALRQLQRIAATARILMAAAGLGTVTAGSTAVVLAELASLASSVGRPGVMARLLAELAVQRRPGPCACALHARRHRHVPGRHGSGAARDWMTCLADGAGMFAQAHWVLSGLERSRAGGPDVESPETGSSLPAWTSRRTGHPRGCLPVVRPAQRTARTRSQHEEAWRALERGCAAKRRLAPDDSAAHCEALLARVKSMCARGLRPGTDVRAWQAPTARPSSSSACIAPGTTLAPGADPRPGHSLVSAMAARATQFTAQLDLSRGPQDGGRA